MNFGLFRRGWFTEIGALFMPRLIVIDGPRTGDWVQLQNENYLGFRAGQLAISHVADLHQQWAFLRVLPDRSELHNLGVGPHILLNNIQFQNSFLKHGDIIAMYDTRFIFDTDDDSHNGGALPPSHVTAPEGQVLGQPNFNAGGPSAPISLSAASPTAAAPSTGTMGSAAGLTANEEDILGSISAPNPKEQISFRVKYRDHDEMMNTMKDAQRMKILLKVSSKLSNFDIASLLKELLDIIFEVMPADRGTILLYSPERKRFRTMASKTRGGGEAKVRISRTIAKEVLRTKESILSADAQADDRFNLGMSIVDEDIRSALCVPILSNDEIMGLIHLDTQNEDEQFEIADCELLTAIGMQAALAIENARLVNEIAEQQRMKYELDLAATIQQQLLPKKLPESSKVEVYGKMIPAKELGGDYFDFIDLGNGEFCICVGDVSGKGLPAGLVMVMAHAYFRPLIEANRSPCKVIAQANRYLFDDTRRDMFMSALLLYWSDADNKFLWTGAGHEHLLIYRAATRETEAIKAGGLVLAMMRDADRLFKESELVLEAGDALVLYTDGVTEAVDAEGAFFAENSLDPLISLVNRYGHLGAKDLLEALLWELRNFMGNAPQADDITIVTVKKL
jgi:phosphoserine phosphatase RsbU/P